MQLNASPNDIKRHTATIQRCLLSSGSRVRILPGALTYNLTWENGLNEREHPGLVCSILPRQTIDRRYAEALAKVAGISVTSYRLNPVICPVTWADGAGQERSAVGPAGPFRRAVPVALGQGVSYSYVARRSTAAVGGPWPGAWDPPCWRRDSPPGRGHGSLGRGRAWHRQVEPGRRGPGGCEIGRASCRERVFLSV